MVLGDAAPGILFDFGHDAYLSSFSIPALYKGPTKEVNQAASVASDGATTTFPCRLMKHLCWVMYEDRRSHVECLFVCSRMTWSF